MSTVRAQDCFFGSDLEDGTIPSGWDIGPTVERQDQDGNGLGEFVSAWVVGNAEQADEGGFFPVPDEPIGNLFAMANDDAPPCNCAMTDVALTTPSIDLSGRSGVVMECRVFHDQALGGGAAEVQVSESGGAWITLTTLGADASEWQRVFIDLSAFDGIPDLRIRFTWSDNGNWASGFAIDDVCVRERFAKDLSVIRVHANDPSISPFQSGDQSLKYRLMPLIQAGAITAAVEVMNTGTDPLDDVEATAFIHQNGSDHGPFTVSSPGQMAPGERRVIPIPTDWVPDATGEVDVMISASSPSGDDDVDDNSGMYILEITGPGWEAGYGAMAADEGIRQGRIGGAQNFIAANRLELTVDGSVPVGISVVFDPGSVADEQVRAILLDQNLAFVDTSARITLTATELDLIALGEPLYFPLTAAEALGQGDYFVGIQHLDGTGEVLVSTSGNVSVGSSVMMEGVNFDVTYIRAAPMVRLHFDAFGVGFEELGVAGAGILAIYPNPMADQGWLLLQADRGTIVTYSIHDVTGRIVQVSGPHFLSTGEHRIALDVSALADGMYVLRATGVDPAKEGQVLRSGQRFQVVRR